MSKDKHIDWKSAPEADDLHSARRYLALLFSDREAGGLVAALKQTKPIFYPAKDILRTSQTIFSQRTIRKCARN